jgi:hypothetical protein
MVQLPIIVAFDSFTPVHSAFRLPVHVVQVPLAPFCETPQLLTQTPYRFHFGSLASLGIRHSASVIYLLPCAFCPAFSPAVPCTSAIILA